MPPPTSLSLKVSQVFHAENDDDDNLSAACVASGYNDFSISIKNITSENENLFAHF